MGAFLISGLSGSGKSTLGRFLEKQGHTVIHTDEEPGLSGWMDTTTQTIVADPPFKPFTKEWLNTHRWVWNDRKMDELLSLAANKTVFFCGGAYNRSHFYGRFSAHFVLLVDDETMVRRLRQREPARYTEDSSELHKMISWNQNIRAQGEAEKALLVDAVRPTEVIADEILDIVAGFER